jgi:hypothetical protein
LLADGNATGHEGEIVERALALRAKTQVDRPVT